MSFSLTFPLFLYLAIFFYFKISSACFSRSLRYSHIASPFFTIFLNCYQSRSFQLFKDISAVIFATRLRFFPIFKQLLFLLISLTVVVSAFIAFSYDSRLLITCLLRFSEIVLFGFFFLLILYLSFLILWLFFVHVFYSRPFLRFYIPAFFTLFLPFFIHSPGCSIHFILCFCLLFLLNCFYFKLFTILFLSFCTYHSCGFYVLLRHSFLYSGVLLSPFA